MFDISIQRHKDANAIETLIDAAFGADRHHKTSYSFREGVNDVSDLRFVALQDDDLVGTIRFWPVLIKGRSSTPALLLGPLGVAPDHQGQGIGAALIEHGLEVARDHGHEIVLLVGGLDYYGRFGFGPATARNITMPHEQPERLLVRELKNDALSGVEGSVKSLASAATNAA